MYFLLIQIQIISLKYYTGYLYIHTYIFFNDNFSIGVVVCQYDSSYLPPCIQHCKKKDLSHLSQEGFWKFWREMLILRRMSSSTLGYRKRSDKIKTKCSVEERRE